MHTLNGIMNSNTRCRSTGVSPDSPDNRESMWRGCSVPFVRPSLGISNNGLTMRRLKQGQKKSFHWLMVTRTESRLHKINRSIAMLHANRRNTNIISRAQIDKTIRRASRKLNWLGSGVCTGGLAILALSFQALLIPWEVIQLGEMTVMD